MASKSSRAASTRSASPPDNVDHFLSIFQRPQKIHVLKTRQNTISSEDLLKKTPIVRVTSVREEDQPPNTKGHPWNTGFFRRIPYAGVLSLFTVLLCAIADAIILWKSDNQEVDTWNVSPSVLLAILSAVANICLQFARSQGVIISWWRKALRGGTLDDLNRYWESGDGVIAAAMSGRGFNMVSLATLVASTVFFDGPLLQRASTIVSKQTTKLVNVTAPIALEIPYGSTAFGVISDAYGPQSLVMNQSFAQVVNSYSNRDPIITQFTGCVGQCSGTVKAAGLAVNCSMDSVPWTTFENLTESNPTVFSSVFNWIRSDMVGPVTYTNGTDPFPNEAFIDFNLTYAVGRVANQEPLGGGVMDNARGQPGKYESCNGTLMMKRCSMRSATLEYPITLVNNTVAIAGSDSSTFAVDHIQAVGDPDPDFLDYHDLDPMSVTTLGGIAMAAQDMFSSSAVHNEGGTGIRMTGSLASQYANYSIGNTSFFTTEDACAINWRDPSSDILNALNEIMFRTAVVTSNTSKYAVLNMSIDTWYTQFYEAYPVNYTTVDSGIPEPQILVMEQTSNIAVFQSHYSFLAAALAIMFLGILVVIPTFHGFWEMGRAASLNPLEIAKAFNAELLRGTGSNASVGSLTKEFGSRGVKYGEVIDEGFEDSRNGERQKSGGSRLELADPSRVKEPRFQALYI